ncbi:uncharacterized protein LOC115359515 isoform X2 [Myripristis murdjan]|uniref:uncharacterized protein LOC115359515 isoform X2 n=1 Tax=Myripristis murdjan TaxID=586833 RepID=UPI001175E91A|nr:uncharacterized protein LOC115359515 isoform X2 [Myripristis murdjan]
MPKKYVYNRETIEILESLWAQGMQNCSTNENKLKIQEAAVATGLVDERIKVWIYHRNRKKRKEDRGLTKRKQLCPSMAKASISPKGMMSEVVAEEVDSKRTSRPGQKEPERDTSLVEETNQATTDLPLEGEDKDSQQETAAHLIQSVEDKIQELQACNCEVIFMVYNHSSGFLSTTGTVKGLDFLNSQNPGIHLQFAATVSNSPSYDNTLT